MKIPWGKREKGNSRLMSFNPERFVLIILGGILSRSLANLFDFGKRKNVRCHRYTTESVLNYT